MVLWLLGIHAPADTLATWQPTADTLATWQPPANTLATWQPTADTLATWQPPTGSLVTLQPPVGWRRRGFSTPDLLAALDHYKHQSSKFYRDCELL